MKIQTIFVIALYVPLFAIGQNSNKRWDFDDRDTAKAELIFVNTNRIDDLLEKQKRINSNTISVYRIQIYSGHRNGSKEAQERFNEIYPKDKAETSYEQPYFKTKVNAFRTRLDAERTLKNYKKYFKNAFIFEEHISIDKL